MAFFDVRVLNPFTKSHLARNLNAVFRSNESSKKTAYPAGTRRRDDVASRSYRGRSVVWRRYDVVTTSHIRRQFYDLYTTSWRRRNWDVSFTTSIRRRHDVWFKTSLEILQEWYLFLVIFLNSWIWLIALRIDILYP